MKILIKKDPRYPLNLKSLRLKAKEILTSFNFSQKTELSINIIGKRKAKDLNVKYRKMDYIPEVLAFPMNEKRADGWFYLGDVVLCFPLVRDQAIKRNCMVEEIMFELLEHGLKNLTS